MYPTIQEGEFVWESGEPFEFVSWGDGEPNGDDVSRNARCHTPETGYVQLDLRKEVSEQTTFFGF